MFNYKYTKLISRPNQKTLFVVFFLSFPRAVIVTIITTGIAAFAAITRLFMFSESRRLKGRRWRGRFFFLNRFRLNELLINPSFFNYFIFDLILFFTGVQIVFAFFVQQHIFPGAESKFNNILKIKYFF